MDRLSNSNKSKQNQSGVVSPTKPAPNAVVNQDSFFKSDIKSIGDYILKKIIEPAVRKMIFDTVVNGLNIALFDKPANTTVTPTSLSGMVQYNNVSQSNNSLINNVAISSRQNATYSNVVRTQQEFESALNAANETILSFGCVRVSELNEFLGITGNWTDQKYGWTDISSARIEPLIGGGCRLIMPKAMQIT